MSKKTTLSRAIRKERCKNNEVDRIPKYAEDFFTLPQKYTVATDGSDFLRTVEYVDSSESKVRKKIIL